MTHGSIDQMPVKPAIEVLAERLAALVFAARRKRFSPWSANVSLEVLVETQAPRLALSMLDQDVVKTRKTEIMEAIQARDKA